MNQADLDRLVEALMYEGYILFPYRRSTKNTQRWTFGGIYPLTEAAAGERNEIQLQCLLTASAAAQVRISLRFLHVISRRIGCFEPPLDAAPPGQLPPYEFRDSLEIDGTIYHGWQEAREHSIEQSIAVIPKKSSADRQPFIAPSRTDYELLTSADHRIPAVLVREQQTLEGSIDTQLTPIREGVYRLTVKVCNTARLLADATRSETELQALMAAHLVLQAEHAQFLSQTDPPDNARELVAACQNHGVWPILVGTPGETDTLLASPMILPDYPQIAPRSPGNLYDGTEIDELLSLCILTLSDAEKKQAAATDPRIRALLERTAALGDDQLRDLHGAFRDGTTAI